MNIDNIIFLANILGEKETVKYISFGEEKIISLINILKLTDIRNMLSHDEFIDFCNKFITGKYGTVLADWLCSIPEFKSVSRIEKRHLKMINLYRNCAYQDELCYIELFYYFKEFYPSSEQKYNTIKNMVLEEIKRVTSPKTTVSKYLESGASLEELIQILKENKITNFNENTEISVSNNSSKKSIARSMKINLSKITSLVTQLSYLNLPKEVERELLQTYYEGHKQCKINGFTDTELTIKEKPSLIAYLSKIEIFVPSSKLPLVKEDYLKKFNEETKKELVPKILMKTQKHKTNPIEKSI